VDLAIILDDWPFDAEDEANNIRKIVGLDGTLKLQLRLRDGVVQWQLENRPDGSRPYGFDSVLAYCRFLLDTRARRGEGRSRGLDQQLIGELEGELVDYSRRMAALLKVGDYDRASRDASHGLDVLTLVREHSSDHSVARECDRFRPQLVGERARAEALLAVRQGQLQGAVEALNRGIDEIGECSADDEGRRAPAHSLHRRRLIELRRSLRERHNIPLSDWELLQSLEAEQELAIEKEDFAMAARLRDKMKLIRDRLDGAG